jgi:hypothetical protein
VTEDPNNFSIGRLGPSTTPVYARQPLPVVSATPGHLPALDDDSSNTASRIKVTAVVETLRATSVNARQPLDSASSAHLPVPEDSSITASRSKIITVVEMLRATTSGPLTPSPTECFPPPPSPADATGQIRTHTVLQGTITALKLVQQIIGLAPVPGLSSLVGVVLNISEVVNVSFGATYISHVKY